MASRCVSATGSACGIPASVITNLLDSGAVIVAGFYLDPYSRSEKRSGAWMDECVVAKELPSGKALPWRNSCAILRPPWVQLPRYSRMTK